MYLFPPRTQRLSTSFHTSSEPIKRTYLDIESLNSDLNSLNDKEALPVFLSRIFKSDRDVQTIFRVFTFGSDVDVKKSGVFESNPSRLFVDVVRDILDM